MPVTSPAPANVELLFAPANSSNPFEIAKRALIANLARLPVPTISVSPDPDQFDDVADFIRSIIAYGDLCMRAIGKEVKANAPGRVDLGVFEAPFTESSASDAAAVCECVGEDWRTEYDETRYERAL